MRYILDARQNILHEQAVGVGVVVDVGDGGDRGEQQQQQAQATSCPTVPMPGGTFFLHTTPTLQLQNVNGVFKTGDYSVLYALNIDK